MKKHCRCFSKRVIRLVNGYFLTRRGILMEVCKEVFIFGINVYPSVLPCYHQNICP